MKILCNDHPFPHVIVQDLFEKDDLKLLWKELDFYTSTGKLLPAKNYGGIPDKTNSRALILDEIYVNSKFSNIYDLECKLFSSDAVIELAKLDTSCAYFAQCSHFVTKIRYYHDEEYYAPHTDYAYPFIGFLYFNKEPKKYSGGELFFPDHDNYEYSCENNSCIIFPGYIKHGVRTVSIKDSNYNDGDGRYCISIFANYNTK
jgi:hypothetical protein